MNTSEIDSLIELWMRPSVTRKTRFSEREVRVMKATRATVKMTTKEATWTVGFLGLTAAAVAMELVAGARKDEHCPAWTNLIVRHVPMPVAIAAAGYLSWWLPTHLVKYYKKARCSK
jgi:small-conductance mechanosensitive channel